MKKIIITIAFIVFIFVVIISCKKGRNDQADNSYLSNKHTGVRLVTLSNGSKTTYTMLEFGSINIYETTFAGLKADMDNYWDAFITENERLNEDELNAKADSIGFNEQQPLIDFENNLNFTNSMRFVFTEHENAWLYNDSLDPATNPSNTYVFSHEEMAMLNNNGEVKIGDSILILSKKGFILIKDGSLTTLGAIENGDSSVLDDRNVITNVNEENDKGACTSWKGRNSDPVIYASDKRVIKHVHFHSYPWKGVSSAEITSYKKKSSGGWKKWAMYMGVINQSYFRDSDCKSGPQGTSGWKIKEAKSVEQNFANWAALPAFRAENGQSVFGFYLYAGLSDYYGLAW